MSKFGNLIKLDIPVLIDFYSNSDIANNASVLHEVALKFGKQAKIIKIDVEKNETLAEALRIKYFPTFIIYKESEMKWRQSGNQKASALIEMLNKYV